MARGRWEISDVTFLRAIFVRKSPGKIQKDPKIESKNHIITDGCFTMMARPRLFLLLIVLIQLMETLCFHSWTFDHACDSMSWTPTDKHQVSLASNNNDVDLDSFDLVVVVLNDTNVTCIPEGIVVMDETYETIVNQALARNETKKIVQFSSTVNGRPRKVAVLDSKKVGSTLGGMLKSEKNVESCAVVLPINTTDLQDLTTDLLSQLYTDQRYKSSQDPGLTTCKTITFVWPSLSLPLETLERAKSVANGVYLTKDVVNAPHNVLNSFALAETAQRLAKQSGGLLHCKILEAKDCEKRGMGAYLGVARGSETYPKFIHVTYRPKGARSKDL